MGGFERTLPPHLIELPKARAALSLWLHDAGVHGENETSDVLVVASELVTNGVFHDGGDVITMRVDNHDCEVFIEVTTIDHLPGRRPTHRELEASDEEGRGLALVHALSHDYRVVCRDRARITTCQVTTTRG